MQILSELFRRFRSLVLRDRHTAELEEEMRLHVDHREARLRERGLAAGAARYAARRKFGNAVAHQERSRDMWGLNWFEHAAADVRFAARRLRHRPGFTIAIITVAALGIGATTAVFSAIDAAMFRPLPFARSSELVTLINANIPVEHAERYPQGRHVLDINDAAAMHDVFASTAAYAAGGLNLSDPVNPRRVRVGVVTTGFFGTLGIVPQVGRTFDANEGRPHGAHSVVLSDELWRTRFGGADVVGTSIELSGVRYSIVGVMARGFNFPNESELWIPLTVPTTDETFAPFRGFLPSAVIARVAPGVTVQTASSRLLANWQRLTARSPAANVGRRDDLLEEIIAKGAAVPLQQELLGDRRKPLVILMGATALLLLIACSNVANLLLSDAASRRREVALREVLGATRGRIVRQLLAESVLLALAGAAIGIALSPAALGVLRAMMPADLAGVAPAELNLRVLAFATVLALITGLTFGMFPALGTVRSDAVEIIKSGGGGASAGGLGSIRRVLIGAELMLTVMLLVGSGLMVRSLHNVLSQTLGANTEHVGTLEISYADGVSRADRLAKLHAILERLSVDPVMRGAAVVNDIPLRDGGLGFRITVEGATKPASPDDQPFAHYLVASGSYFATLGIPLVRGRTFTAADDSLAPAVALINLAMAQKWWPDVDPIGRRFRIGSNPTPVTVIGVVGDMRERGLERVVLPQVYLSIDRRTPENVAVVARGSLPAGAFLSRITDAVHAVDPTQAVYNVRMLDDIVAGSVAPRRTNTILITIFGGIALALSAFGVYGVVSYGVGRRTREFGIRAALGATGRDITALVGLEMAWIVGIAIVLGLAAAWGLSRVMGSLLFGVTSHDFATFIAAPVMLLIPAALATFIPARRATRVSPSEVMRAE